MPEPFSWLMFLVGGDHDHLAIAHAWVATLFILALALLVSGKIKRATASLSQADLIPEDRLTLRNGFELYVTFIHDSLMSGLLGKDARKHFWLVGTIFIYVFVSNFMGVLPGLLPPTENINTNAAVAIIVFLYYNLVGIRVQGLGPYLKHMAGPILALAWLIFPIEIFAHLVRPVTLAVRLFGNINGDHIVLGIFSQLIPSVSIQALAIGIPVIFLGLGMFVSIVQAFVFSLLTTIYIAVASDDGHGGDHHDHH